ncbi:MAG TPA: tetratricopeptide repeat protein [Rhizomicrobium sp.]|nr:tetratricopeptide repeat protein [Rhizomicrobium sp.]
MAVAAALKSIDSLSGVDAKMAALERLEQLFDQAEAHKERHKSNVLLKRAVRIWRKGDTARATQWALKAVEADDTNPKAYHLLAMGLERLGHLHKALVTYERAFQLDPADPELLINLGLTAWNLKMTEAAAKLFELYIAACPNSPLGYNNLGSVLCDLGRPDEGIEILRGAIYRMPGEAILWNSLGTVLAEAGRAAESLVFYNEAIRLQPSFARGYHNLGYAYQHLGELEKALAHYDLALSHVTDPMERMEARHSRSICMIGAGKLEEGFREYEIRNDERFRAYLHHVIKAPRWNGEPALGLKLLLVGEQGLGDEFMFADILPDVIRALGPDGKLQVAVDPRLVPLFQRSFPQAEIGAYEDRTLIDKDGNKALRFVPFAEKDGGPDMWAMMGSALAFYRKSLVDFPKKPLLVPDRARVEEFRARLAKLPGKKVGVCWRSMMLGAKRAKYFSGIEGWAPVLKTPGVSFVNLQYGDCSEELARAGEHGIVVHQMEGLDLRNDIDGAAALSAALDLVLSAPTAAAATAASVGTDVWFITAGRAWPQLGTDEYPWYARTRVLWPEQFGDWASLMPRVAKELAAFASK